MMGRRIIPARAGFTLASTRPGQPAPDHPRSRGVYPVPAERLPITLGIIPARAGFTRPLPHRHAGGPDHPRSRGVYPARPPLPWAASGSSPLARGLPRPGTHPHAHAPDHPRSRGVYSPIIGTARHAMGSSPLARGLRSTIGTMVTQPGIIPARAGFTRRPVVPCVGPGDHPRSRGVYRASATHVTLIFGSSPLARGLRGDCAGHGGSFRIIPARAGFTPARRRLCRRRRDHPRSRGVYGAATTPRSASTGSSPLARGLLSAAPRMTPSSRIIPARAGFTDAESAPGCAVGDHPRSRGVYWTPLPPRSRLTGSSPLARGLPSPPRCSQQGPRIIPARAGFTTSTPAPGGEGPDHPRSRGVYQRRRPRFECVHGSSPLARGLRDDAPEVVPAPRIIPARAGFTIFGSSLRRCCVDHPRSRGVYTCGSLESQRTRTLPDPCCLHCRPRARSAELR